MLYILYSIIPAVIKLILFITGAGLEAYSDYLTAEYLSMGASTNSMMIIMWWVGIGLGITRFFLGPIAFSQLKNGFSFGAASRALCSIILTCASIIFSVGFFDSSSDNLIKEVAHAEHSLKDRENKIAEAKNAITRFDEDSFFDKRAYEGLIEKGSDSKAINANRARRSDRQRLVDNYNEALSLPCEKIPDMGQLNRMYIGLTGFIYPNIKEENKFNEKMKFIRLCVNVIISFCIDFALMNALVASKFGEIINECFVEPTKSVSNPGSVVSKSVSVAPEVEIGDIGEGRSDPKDHQTAPLPKPPTPKINNSKPLILKSVKWYQGGITPVVSKPVSVVSAPEPLIDTTDTDIDTDYQECEDKTYNEIKKYVLDYKRLYPHSSCGVNKITEAFKIRKNTVSAYFKKGVDEGVFKKTSLGYEPTEKLIISGE